MTRRGGALNAELRPRRTPRGDHRDDAPDAATATPVRTSSSSHPADSSSSPRALHPAAADALRHIDALARRVGLPRANDPERGSARTFPAEAETRAAADRTLEAERVDAERHREARVRARVRAARDDRDDTSRPTVPRHLADVSRPTVPRRFADHLARRRVASDSNANATDVSNSHSTVDPPPAATSPSSPATPSAFVARGAADAALEDARAALARAADADARLMRAAVAPTPAPPPSRTRRERPTRETGTAGRGAENRGGDVFESGGDGSEDRRDTNRRGGAVDAASRDERDDRRGGFDDPFAFASRRRAETAARREALAARVRRWKNGEPDAEDRIRTDDDAVKAAAKARASAATLARALRRLERVATEVPAATTGTPPAARARAPGETPSHRSTPSRRSTRASSSPANHSASIDLPASIRIPTRDETLDVIRAMEERARSRHAETVVGPENAAAWMVRRAERDAGPGEEQNADDDAATAAVRGLRRLRLARTRTDAETRTDADDGSDDGSDADSAGLSPPTRPTRRDDGEGAHSDCEGADDGCALSASPPTRPPPFATRISPAGQNPTAGSNDDDDECSDAPDAATFAGDETGRLRHVKDFESLMAYAFD